MKKKRDDMRKAYKRDLARVKPSARLSKNAMIQMVKADQQMQLIEAMLPYALQLANNYQAMTSTADMDFMDLVQEASMALMQAVKQWDPNKGLSLTHFIKYYVRGRFSRLSKSFAQRVVSIDALIEEAESSHNPSAMWRLQEILSDTSNNPEAITTYLQLMGWLDKHSETLPARQMRAVRLFCGLDTGKPANLVEIAQEMGISSPAVKKLLAKGLRFPD